jgi:hypothetical protein
MNFIQRVKIGNAYTKYTFGLSKYAFIRWEPKCSTEIHDHGGKDCDFIVLNGSLQEARYKDKYLGALYSSRCVEPLMKTTMKKTDGYHQMFNFDDWVKYSIHKYYD